MPINGEVIDQISGVNSVLLKPTVNSSSGRGIIKFVNDGSVFRSIDGNYILTNNYLLSYGDNFCLQECVSQCSMLDMLCDTSINTIRIATYRSIVDEEIHVLSSILRIGQKGSYVDNAHAGGKFIGVNVDTGELGKYVIDQFGSKNDTWNGVDFRDHYYNIPNWDKVIAFAKDCTQKILHHRLIALDIALDERNNPVLIEYNVEGFSYWLFMYTGQTPLGNYTDEIVDYCKQNK